MHQRSCHTKLARHHTKPTGHHIKKTGHHKKQRHFHTKRQEKEEEMNSQQSHTHTQSTNRDVHVLVLPVLRSENAQGLVCMSQHRQTAEIRTKLTLKTTENHLKKHYTILTTNQLKIISPYIVVNIHNKFWKLFFPQLR